MELELYLGKISLDTTAYRELREPHISPPLSQKVEQVNEVQRIADYDDIQLDAETLRKIEEEARREAEAELAADETIMQEIETQVLQEMGAEDVDLDDDFMADLKNELSNLYD